AHYTNQPYLWPIPRRQTLGVCQKTRSSPSGRALERRNKHCPLRVREADHLPVAILHCPSKHTRTPQIPWATRSNFDNNIVAFRRHLVPSNPDMLVGKTLPTRNMVLKPMPWTNNNLTIMHPFRLPTRSLVGVK